MFVTIGTVSPERKPEAFLRSLPLFPVRDREGNKGTYGRVTIFSGSTGMSGASCLCGCGALVAGAGLVRLAVPDRIMDIVAGFAPEYMTYPMPSTRDGAMAELLDSEMAEVVTGSRAVAVGPGLGRASETGFLVRRLLRNVSCPVVVDADALYALSPIQGRKGTGPRVAASAARILTPHPGEFARLTGVPVPDDDEGRKAAALEFVQEHRARLFLAGSQEPFILVLKGANTVITDGKEVYVNETGNPGLATGGTGDVLTGIITALLAQKLTPLSAARLGVAIHGLAADCAATQIPWECMTASDVVRYFPSALRILREVQA